MVAARPDVEVLMGSDSHNRSSHTVYTTTVVLRFDRNGAHVIYRREKARKVNDLWTRLWGEVERSLAVAHALRTGAGVHVSETSPGNLPFRSIIHVAGINMLWRSSERSIRDSVRNAVSIAQSQGYQSLALPLIGAGSGGGNAKKVQAIIEDELTRCHFDGEIRIVRYLKTAAKKTPSEGATL